MNYTFLESVKEIVSTDIKVDTSVKIFLVLLSVLRR